MLLVAEQLPYLRLQTAPQSTSCSLEISPSTASSPQQTEGNKKDCEECGSDLGAFTCGPTDNSCLTKQCEATASCKSCGKPCSSYVVSVRLRNDVPFAYAITSARPQQMSNKLSPCNMIVPVATPRFNNFNHLRLLHKRTAHGKAWMKYAHKGSKYFQTLKIAPMEDTQKPKMCELDAYFEVSKNGPTDKKIKSELLEKVQIQLSASYYAVEAQGPKDDPTLNS